MPEQVSFRRCDNPYRHGTTVATDQVHGSQRAGPHLPDPLGTPPQRVLELSEISDDVKARVDAATAPFTGSRCLIENSEGRRSTEYVHVIDRSTPSTVVIQLTSLEMCWNIPPGTLNVDSSQNIFRLSPKYHYLFNEDGWLLLPEKHIMRQYLDAVERPPSEFPVIDDASYKYTILVHKKMKPISICRQMDPLDGSGAQSAEDFTYPYEELGTIVSHLHPRLVIVGSGYKWERQSIYYNTNILAKSKCAQMIFQLHFSWTTRWQLSEERYSIQPEYCGSDITPSDSAHTPPIRLRRSHRGNTKCQADPPSGSPHPTHRGQDQSNVWHDRQDPTVMKASILLWMTGVESSRKNVETSNQEDNWA